MRHLFKYTVVLFYTLLISFGYWLLYKKPMIGIDDANIYFVYVKNFVDGYGFVYTPGGERVEGFTSILWVLIISPLYYLGSYFETAILVLDIIIVSICLYISIIFINQLTRSHRFLSIPAIFFLMIIAIVPGYFDWTILTLMETGFWSLLLTATIIVLCWEDFYDRTNLFSFLLFLLLLTRPESLLWCIVFIVLAFFRFYFHRFDLIAALKGVFSILVIVLLTLTGLIVFRYSYFGYPLPNTYYAKMSTNIAYNLGEGIRYFIFCILQSPLIVIVVLTSIISAVLLSLKVFQLFKEKSLTSLDRASQIQIIITVVTLVSILIPIYVGGDHFKLLRFYQPFVPIYFFLVLNFIFWAQYIEVEFKGKFSLLFRITALIGLAPFFYLLTETPLHTFIKSGSPIDGEFKLAELGKEEGLMMNKLFARMDKLPSVGVSAAGGFTYSYSGNVIDLMGLNNVKMAHALKEKIGMKNHAAFDKSTFYEQHPDIFHGYKKISSFVKSAGDTLVLENDPVFKEMHVFRLYKGIFDESRFRQEYSPVVVFDPSTSLSLKTYCQHAYIDRLREKGYVVSEIERISKIN